MRQRSLIVAVALLSMFAGAAARADIAPFPRPRPGPTPPPPPEDPSAIDESGKSGQKTTPPSGNRSDR